jgi:hypothetical protein
LECWEATELGFEIIKKEEEFGDVYENVMVTCQFID